MSRLLVGAIAAATLVLAGCADAGEPEDFHPAFAEFIAHQIDYWAVEYSASEEQVEILRRAEARGSVVWEDVEEAYSTMRDCLREHQIRFYAYPDEDDLGIPVKVYSVGPPPGVDPFNHDGPWVAVADRCFHAHYSAVEGAYRAQPISRELQEAYWDENLREPMIECLRGHQWDFDAEGSSSDIEAAALDLIRASYEWTEVPDVAYDCLHQARYPSD